MSRGDLSKAKIHVLIFTLFCSVASIAQTTVIRSTEINDVLVIPGMGIETFNRFAGQELNEGTTWSEVGPETALPDAPPGAVGPASISKLTTAACGSDYDPSATVLISRRSR